MNNKTWLISKCCNSHVQAPHCSVQDIWDNKVVYVCNTCYRSLTALGVEIRPQFKEKSKGVYEKITYNGKSGT